MQNAKENYRVSWAEFKVEVVQGCPEGTILKQIWVEQSEGGWGGASKVEHLLGQCKGPEAGGSRNS